MKSLIVAIICFCLTAPAFGVHAAKKSESKNVSASSGGTCQEALSPYAMPKQLAQYKDSAECSRFLLEKGLNNMDEWMKKDPAVESAIAEIVTKAVTKGGTQKDVQKYSEDQGILIALKYLRGVIDYCLCLDK